MPLLEHAQELIKKLAAMGIDSSATHEEGDGREDEGWEDVDTEDEGDVDMG